jgi:hypothetical protein
VACGLAVYPWRGNTRLRNAICCRQNNAHPDRRGAAFGERVEADEVREKAVGASLRTYSVTWARVRILRVRIFVTALRDTLRVGMMCVYPSGRPLASTRGRNPCDAGNPFRERAWPIYSNIYPTKSNC